MESPYECCGLGCNLFAIMGEVHSHNHDWVEKEGILRIQQMLRGMAEYYVEGNGKVTNWPW